MFEVLRFSIMFQAQFSFHAKEEMPSMQPIVIPHVLPMLIVQFPYTAIFTCHTRLRLYFTACTFSQTRPAQAFVAYPRASAFAPDASSLPAPAQYQHTGQYSC